jgi:hypothetical protein
MTNKFSKSCDALAVNCDSICLGDLPMYTPEERGRLRMQLLEAGARDPYISGTAITGSAACGGEDRWSDIDLAFGVGDAAELPNVLQEWTERMYSRYGALHHLDMQFGEWTYRVFLLANTLQVDLAFVPAAQFRALAPTFQLVSGIANEARHAPATQAGDIVGLGWLYAVHARSSIARGKFWQAEYMVSGIRDQALALACIRHGLPAVHGKGVDQLPRDVTAPLEGCLVRELSAGELRRAFGCVLQVWLDEILKADPELGERLRDVAGKLMQV